MVLLTASLSNHSHAQEIWQTIGRFENGQPVLDINKAQALRNFNRSMQSLTDIEDTFTEVKIVQHLDYSYALVFVGRSHLASFLVRNTGNGWLDVMASTTCTTTECSEEAKGCIPKTGGGCTPCNNGGTCTKTSSDASLF